MRRKNLTDRLTFYYRKVNEHTLRQLATGRSRPLRFKRLVEYRDRIIREVGRGWNV